MIIVCLHREYSDPLKRNVLLISHGYDTLTDEVVILPCEPLDHVDYVGWNSEIGEYVVRETK